MITFRNSMNLIEQEINHNCEKWRSDSDGQTGSVKFGYLINTFELVTLKVLHSKFCQVKRLPTFTSRRVTGAKRAFELKSFDLAGMQSSSVVATRSGGSPSVNLLSTDGDAHGVSRVERFHSAPTNGGRCERVDNGDCFIIENYLGPYKEQINTVTYKDSPSDCDQVALQINHHDGLKYQYGREEIGDCSRNQSTFGTKKVGILHRTIFSQINSPKGIAA